MCAVRVLVVEDEEALADAIARGLRREGMAVDVAGDGGVALEKAATNGYDVVVLDRDLPVVHGDDVCRSLIAVVAGAGRGRDPPDPDADRLRRPRRPGRRADARRRRLPRQAVRLHRAGGPHPGAGPAGRRWR